MTPEHAKFLSEVVGKQLQTEWMMTYKVIKAVPEDKKSYKPQADSRDAWFLAHHIATADVGFLRAVNANDFGAFKVDKEGVQIAHRMVFFQWQDGKKVIVWPEELAPGKPRFPTPPWSKR